MQSVNYRIYAAFFDYDDIKKELGVKEIKHYVMYVEDGILSKPMFYVTKDKIFIAMGTISFGEAEDDVRGIEFEKIHHTFIYMAYI